MRQIVGTLTTEKLASYFDHTLLRADATDLEFEALCAESRQYGFRMVAINPAPVALCKKLLAGCGVHVGAAIGFPLGQNTIKTKVFETRDAITNGADEIDYVVNLTRLKEKDYDYIEREMSEIVGVCRESAVTSKVIFETCYLTDQEKKELCRIACSVGPDFIKTSTGFGNGGATLEDLRLMRDCVSGSGIKLKASGGVRSLETALAMIALGVERIGSTASVSILKEFMQKKG